MTMLHGLLVHTHVIVGAAALLLFWIPVFARKGSPVHVRAGRYYGLSMYLVSISAFCASVLVLADPVGIRRPGLQLNAGEAARLADSIRAGSLFLLMLSVLVFASVRHGLAALRERERPGILRQPLHRGMIIALGLLGAVVGVIGIARGLVLLMIFAGIAVSAAIGMFRETRIERLTANERTIAHLGGLIGSGIGTYTAFFAFGGARFLGDLLPGQWQTLSWVIAPVIGTIAIARLTRRYRGPATSRQSA